MDRIETTKLLPALGKHTQRELLTLQGEWNGQRIDCAAWVDYEIANDMGEHTQAEDIAVVGLWGELGGDLLAGYGEDGTEKMPPYYAYMYQCAAAAAAGHVSLVEIENVGYEGWIGGIDFAGNSNQMGLARGGL